MANKIEKNLNFTCSACFSTFQLLEIHEPKKLACANNCPREWQELLNKHYQEHIILYLAQEEARKEEKP